MSDDDDRELYECLRGGIVEIEYTCMYSEELDDGTIMETWRYLKDDK